MASTLSMGGTSLGASPICAPAAGLRTASTRHNPFSLMSSRVIGTDDPEAVLAVPSSRPRSFLMLRLVHVADWNPARPRRATVFSNSSAVCCARKVPDAIS